MRHLTLLFTFILFYARIFSQNLTLQEIQSFKNKTLAYAEEYLVSKKWEVLSLNGSDNIISFSYNKNNYDNKAESFINLYYDNYSKRINSIRLQINSLKKYNILLNSIKINNYTLYYNSVDDNSFNKTYKKNSSLIDINSSIHQQDESYFGSNTQTMYSFYFYSLILVKEDSYKPQLTLEENILDIEKEREIALNLFSLGKYVDAKRYYLKFIDMEGVTEDDYINLAKCFELEKNYQKSVIYYLKADSLNSNIDILRKITFTYDQLNNTTKYLYYSQNLLANVMATADDFNNVAWYLMRNKKFNEAIEYLNTGIFIDDDNLYLKSNLALCYLLTGKYEIGIEIIEKYKSSFIDDEGTTWDTNIVNTIKQLKNRGINNAKFEQIIASLKNKK